MTSRVEELQRMCDNINENGGLDSGQWHTALLAQIAQNLAVIADVMMADHKTEPTQEWTPCSDRLPNESGEYLTWSKIGFVPDHVDDPYTREGICIAYFSKRFSEWFGTEVEKVIAWMPLPDPMKGAYGEREGK